jgi:hypothetical protein
MRGLFALALHVGAAALCTGCMDTRTASLGSEDQRRVTLASDAASAPVKRDAGASVTEADRVPRQVDAAEPNDDGEVRVDDGGLADAGQDGSRDAGSMPVSIDAGRVVPVLVDAGVTDASGTHHDDERDGAREDARAPINPLCIAEPWHCQ